MVDFLADDTAELRAWRSEVREFLETALPAKFCFDYDYDEDPVRWAQYREFWRKVGAKGWIGLTWPKEYYGLGRSAIEYWILHEEFTNYAVPSMGVIGAAVANSLLRVGTHEQRIKHLKGIAEFTTMWGEGYSEPQAGSDLAAITTHARLEGDEWVINGQKTLGTAAHQCQWMCILARTDPNARRNAGISCFMVPLDAPGVTMLPLHNMAGGQQNQTYFDNVRVPRESLLGDEGQAWSQIWFRQGGNKLEEGPTLDAWRGRLIRTLGLLKGYAENTSRNGAPLSEDSSIRLQLAELELGVEIFKLHATELYSNTKGGRLRSGSAVFNANLMPTFHKEFWPNFAQVCMEILGPMSQVTGGPLAPLNGHIEHFFRGSFGNHAGGTSQLKRMVMATRGLGLPR